MVTRISLLSDGYFTWLPFPVTASIVVIIANVAMMIYPRYWFRQGAWVSFSLIGVMVTVSLLVIQPFDFNVIPNVRAAGWVPVAVTVFFILLAVFYGATAAVLGWQLRRCLRRQKSG